MKPPTETQIQSGHVTDARDPWTYGPCEMPGQLCSKSNGRQKTADGRFIKSRNALQYVSDFLKLMPRPARPYEGLVRFDVWAYYKDWRRDLDVALLQDCLQKGGIIKNDRQVVEIHAYRHLDKQRPRTRFMLTAVEGKI